VSSGLPWCGQRRSARVGLASAMVFVAFATTGCGCVREHGDPIPYADGATVGNEYASSPIAGPWLPFPGGRRYRLLHDLGRAPTEVTAYLSFDAEGRGNFSTATGNSALFTQVTDSYVAVYNDSCADFFLRVVASVPAGEATP
jgi:hypothetical protein